MYIGKNLPNHPWKKSFGKKRVNPNDLNGKGRVGKRGDLSADFIAKRVEEIEERALEREKYGY